MDSASIDEVFHIDDDHKIPWPDSVNSYPYAASPNPEMKHEFSQVNLSDSLEIVELPSTMSNKVEEEKIEKKHSTRGRKKKIIDIKDAKEIKRLRAEKNRIFAKKSRDRKRQYITSLEEQVSALKKELSYYKRQLSKYELIEENENKGKYEFCNVMYNAYQKMGKMNQPITNNHLLLEIINKEYLEKVKQERKVLWQLTKKIAEIVMPLGRRIMVRLAELKADIHNPESLVKAANGNISMEQAIVGTNYLKKLYPEEQNENGEFIIMAKSAIKIKESIRKIIENQKDIQIELKDCEEYLIKEGLRNYDPYILEGLALLNPQLIENPELSDQKIYDIDDTDYGIGDLTISNGNMEEVKSSRCK